MNSQNAVIQKAQMSSILDAPVSSSTSNEEAMQHINVLLDRLFEASEADRWLHAPQNQFGGQMPMELITHGDAARVLHVLIRLDEGIHV